MQTNCFFREMRKLIFGLPLSSLDKIVENAKKLQKVLKMAAPKTISQLEEG